MNVSMNDRFQENMQPTPMTEDQQFETGHSQNFVKGTNRDLGMKVPQWVRGAELQWGSEAKLPEARDNI